jgi:hypothetical protein
VAHIICARLKNAQKLECAGRIVKRENAQQQCGFISQTALKNFDCKERNKIGARSRQSRTA